ncbi:jojoba acyl CoA reductase-related male sterility protein [Wolffia australiana]
MGSLILNLGSVGLGKKRSFCFRQRRRVSPDMMRAKPTVSTMASLSSTQTKILPPLTNNVDLEEEEVSYREMIAGEANVPGLGIVDSLKGKCLLITGATGFLGKVLVEKILRVAPDVGKIYLLIQAKNEEAAVGRLKSEIIDTELFKVLREEHGEDFQEFVEQKLIPVRGNVRLAELGIPPETIDEIVGAVDIFVNSAANTTFDERYDVALDINTAGPGRLMSLARRCEKVELFVQVSTAYVNGQRRGKILEKPFAMGDTIAAEIGGSWTAKLDVEEEMKLAAQLRDLRQGNDFTQEMKILGLERAKLHGWQDTYTFTKAMGEMMVNSMRGDIPVVTMRPSVIESTYREPFPGWMEGNRMMDPIILYYGKGQLTGFLADPEGVLDVVPADMVVNATLAAMAKHVGKSGTHEFHVASSAVNPLVFRDLAAALFDHFTASPIVDSAGRQVHVSRIQLFQDPVDFSSHLAAAVAADKSQMTALTSAPLPDFLSHRVKQMSKIYMPYTFYAGRFDNTNTAKLTEEMNEEERRAFGFDVTAIGWQDYISAVHIPGLRRHVLKGRGGNIGG